MHTLCCSAPGGNPSATTASCVPLLRTVLLPSLLVMLLLVWVVALNVPVAVRRTAEVQALEHNVVQVAVAAAIRRCVNVVSVILTLICVAGFACLPGGASVPAGGCVAPAATTCRCEFSKRQVVG